MTPISQMKANVINCLTCLFLSANSGLMYMYDTKTNSSLAPNVPNNLNFIIEKRPMMKMKMSLLRLLVVCICCMIEMDLWQFLD